MVDYFDNLMVFYKTVTGEKKNISDNSDKELVPEIDDKMKNVKWEDHTLMRKNNLLIEWVDISASVDNELSVKEKDYLKIYIRKNFKDLDIKFNVEKQKIEDVNLLFTKTGNSENPLEIEIIGKKAPKKVKKTSGEDNGGEKPKRAPRKKKSDDVGVELN
jgi:hypothetical protein